MAIAAIPAALRAITASKYFWPLLISGGFLGQTALSEVGKAGERGVAREQLRVQELLGTERGKAARRATEEARDKAKEYTKMTMELLKESRKESRESELMQSFLQSQDRQAALLMSAIQAISQRPQYRAAPTGGGMLGLMRGNL
jgi:hypothetical protein